MVAFNICGPTTLYWLYRHLMDLSPAYSNQPIRMSTTGIVVR